MKLKSALLAVLAGSAAIAAPAFAHDGNRDGGWYRGYHGYSRHYVPAPVYYRPAPRVVYVPAPVYYRPAPVVVTPGLSIRFNLPL